MKSSLFCKGIISFLIVSMIMLASCNTKDVSPSNTSNSEASTISKDSNSFENVFQDFIEREELDVTQDEFRVINTQMTDKGTTWRIKQQYKGIEVYNGDLLIAADTDNNIEYYTGTYYEKLDCIENFDAKITSAKSMSNWMENAEIDDNNWLKIDTSSLKPYIYITEDNEVDIVRQFRIYYCIEGEYGNADVLTDINQGEIYDVVFNTTAYEPAVLEAPPYSVDVVKEGNIYYLYNPEHNYFVLNTEEIDQEKLQSYLIDDNGKSKIEYDFKNMLSTHQQTWKADFGRVIVQSMLTMNEVSDYWKTNYKVDGIYGDGSVYGLIVRNGYMQGTAMSLGGTIIACGRSKDYTHSIADAPEVLVHEFSHGILQNFAGISSSNGDPASLHEGISDIFAAVYNKDWSIGKGIGAAKDIAKTNYTMSDYLSTDDFLSSWNYIISSVFSAKRINCTYHNSYIVSHTVYKVWKDILDKDYDTLGNILFNSLKYMPNQPTFSDFAYAFIQSTEDLCGKSKADLCKKCFNASGYKLNGNSVFYKTPVGRPRLVDNTETSASSEQPDNNFVHTAREEQFKYSDDLGNNYDITFKIPTIMSDSADAISINNSIQIKYNKYFEEVNESMKNGYSTHYYSIDYDYYVYGDILSVLITTAYDNGTKLYDVYNFDISSKKSLDNDSIIKKLSKDKALIMTEIRNSEKAAYEKEYGNYKSIDSEFYNKQYTATFADENLNNSVLFVNNEGLSVVVSEYTLAGQGKSYRIINLK